VTLELVNYDHLGSALLIIAAVAMSLGLAAGYARETQRRGTRFDNDINALRTPGMGDFDTMPADEIDPAAADRIRAAVLAEARALARDNARRSGEVDS
jgi:hypothetical protein